GTTGRIALEPGDLIEERRLGAGIPAPEGALQVHEPVPRDVRGIVRLERPRAVDRDPVSVQVHSVEEQLRAVHVVVERLLRARGRTLFEGIVEPEPQCLPLERPGRPPHRRGNEGRRSSRQDEHYRLATSQSWMARWVSPDRWNTFRASSEPLTMGASR